MKKLLLMGSNFGTKEIIKEARRRGYYTIVTDNRDAAHSNAKKECDECWAYSTSETEALAKKCREENVDGAACGVSEFNSDMTFALCDAAGLAKYCTDESGGFARNKRKCKDICGCHGVLVAKDYDLSGLDHGEEPQEVDLPVVVKPIDSAANVGVSFCYEQGDLKPAYELAKKVTKHPETIICEQMLRGAEYASCYALADGRASLLNVFAMHNEEGYPANIYTLDITTTGMLDKYLSEIDGGMKEVFLDAGFRDGIVWVEFMHNESDDLLYVLECGYRMPASMIPYTYKEIMGFDAVGWYLDGFMGIRHDPSELPPSQTKEYGRYGVSYLLWNDSGGTIKSIEGLEEIASDDRVDIVDCLREPGSILSPKTIMAEVLFTADTREDVIDIIKSVNDKVKVITEDGKDVLIRFTSFDKIR